MVVTALVRRRALAVTVVLVVLFQQLMLVGVGRADELPEPPPPVVLIGVSGLTWDDVDESSTPAIATFAASAAIGHLSVRSVYRVTCPVDAWLTIGAARRAAADREAGADEGEVVDLDATCPPIPSVVAGRVEGWSDLVAFNDTLNYGAQLGLLGENARETGTDLLAAGGAAVGASDQSGRVIEYVDDPLAVSGSALARSNISMIDLGGVDERSSSATRPQQVEKIDAEVGELLGRVPDDATVILLAGANSRPAADLQIIAIRGDDFAPGLLTSTSTRQDGLVLLTDVTPTLFELSGMPADPDFVGAPVTSVPRDPEAGFDERRQDLIDETRKVRINGDVAPPFFISVIVLQLVFYAWVVFALRRRPSDRSARAALRLAHWVAIVSCAIPVSTFLANLVPWWTWGPAHVGLVALVLGWAFAVAISSHWVGRDRDLLAEVGVVSAVTVAVLAADIVTGGSLQTASLMGYSPVIAGRLYGLGNVAFALFATALIFLAAWCGGLASRRDGPGRAPQVVLGIGVIGLVVVGLPAFGSDFGGMLAMTTGFGVFYLGTRGRRMTARRLLAIGGASVGVVALVSVVDWLRPAESRSHLGTFVQQVLDGELGDVLARKLANNLDILVNSALAASVLLVLIVLAALLLRPFDRSTSVLHRAFAEAPLLGPALTGWLTVMVVGFAVNDSGVAIPAVGMMLTVPFLIVISVKLLSRQERTLQIPSVGASVD